MTFVEVLVAGSIAALTLTVAIIAYATILNSPARTGATVALTLPGTAMSDFYNSTNSTLGVPSAPNYGMAAAANVLREQLEEDIASATAVFCLARNGQSTIRPTVIRGFSDVIARATSDPDAFRLHIEDASLSGVSGASGVFGSYSNVANGFTNTSLFILTASTNSTMATVKAVYETDFVETDSPPGIYASVRRYPSALGSSGFDYYHIFYGNDEGRFGVGDTNNFQPPAVYFARKITTNGVTSDDRFRIAEERPFYFLWWPDPASPRLYHTNSFSGSTNSARAAYPNMGNRTQFFFVIPAFPAL